MKSILFIMRYPLEEKHHLKQKFDGQMAACVNLGYQVKHFAYDKKKVYLIDVNNGTKEIVGKAHFTGFKKYRNSFGFLDLFSSLKKIARKESFDYIYMRSKTVNWTAVDAIEKMRDNGCKLIVEIPSFQNKEKVLSSTRKVIMKVANHWNHKLQGMIDLYTAIGPDCKGEINGRPAMNIENGICLDTIPCREYHPQDEIHLLALASMRSWHAYDRLLKGLGNYKGSKNIIIDMVGGDNDGSLAEWKSLAEQLEINDKVRFHGPKFGDELTKMFQIADAGIATLGLHRTGITVGSVLKTREYMARGLPFIYGYEDLSLPKDYPYTLQFPATEDPIDIEKVLNWVGDIRNEKDVPQTMRRYAQDHMSWESIYKAVFEKADSVS